MQQIAAISYAYRRTARPRGTAARQRRMPLLLSALFGVLLLFAQGCLQLETRIALQPDGSAIVTERLQFSRALLDLSASQPTLNVTPLLERARALERMAAMGQGVSLVSHEVRDAEGGAREAISVFKVGDLNQFQYLSPFFGYSDYPSNNLVACKLFPIYENTWYGRSAGEMGVSFKLPRDGRRPQRPKEGEPPPPEIAPAELQMLRELRPIMRDMLSGFSIRLTFESYAPLRIRQYYRFRNQLAATREIDLLDCSDRNLDPTGSPFLDNEEIMLELARGEFNLANLLEAVKESGSNFTLPIYNPFDTPEYYFKPTNELFKRYFEGKTLKSEKREWPARAEELVYKSSGVNGGAN